MFRGRTLVLFAMALGAPLSCGGLGDLGFVDGAAFEHDDERDRFELSSHLVDCASSLATCVEAEAGDRILSRGVQVCNGANCPNHPGASGGGFVDLAGQGSSVTWPALGANRSGLFEITFGYANGSSDCRPLILYIDGARHAGELDFCPTLSWSHWKTESVVLLLSGARSIKLEVSTSLGGPNLDYVDIRPMKVARIDAEDWISQSGCIAEQSHLPEHELDNYYLNFVDRPAEVSWRLPSVPRAGRYDLTIRYANGKSSTRTVEMHVNGRSLGIVDFSPTGSWDSWHDKSISLHLTEGSGNFLEILASNDGPNLDYFLLEGDGLSGLLEPQPPLKDVVEAQHATRSDYAFVRPDSSGPTISPIVGYSWRGYHTEKWASNASHWEWPIYSEDIIDRNTDAYWDYVVDELLLARVDVLSYHGRGAWYPDVTSQIGKGTGDMDPRLLTRLVAALDRAGARDAVRLAMWDDTGMWDGNVAKVFGSKNFDFRKTEHCDFAFDHNIKLFFETIPQDLWYTVDGRPVVSFWTVTDMVNGGSGGAASCLQRIHSRFKGRFNRDPYFIVQLKWKSVDPSVAKLPFVLGFHDWFSPGGDNLGRFINHNGFTAGAVAPGYREKPGVIGTSSDRTVDREHGQRFVSVMQDGLDKDADFILLEGWTNMIEGAGFYRSEVWTYPNQYINLTRAFADPTPATLRFQAEGADDYRDTTAPNTLGDYSTVRGIDVMRGGSSTSGSQYYAWCVGDIEPSEWLQYRDVQLGAGTYRFTARIATSAQAQMEVTAAGSRTTETVIVILPDTHGQLEHLRLVDLTLPAGTFNLRWTFLTDNIEMTDWFHIRRLD